MMFKQTILCRNCVFRALQSRYQCRAESSDSKNIESPLKRLLGDASAFGEGKASEGELEWATQPYAVRGGGERVAERTAPEDTSVLLFPGQGSQRVGMGSKLMHIPAARDLYELASTVVGWDVARVCLEGPEEELNRRCQTAVMVTSLAALERVREERPGALQRVRAAAGFSLGEISALVFARALPLEDALRLVELRAAAMRAAGAARPGGMLTVWLAADARLPLALRRAEEHARRAGVAEPVCRVANYLYPGCKVVAGDEAALEFVQRCGGEWGVRRAARLPVEGAFHSALMASAAEAVRAGLQAVRVEAPRVRVVSAVGGGRYGDAAHVRRLVARHVAAPLRWEQTLQALYARPRGERFPLTVALGPGTALRSMLRQVNARAWDSSIQIEV